MTTVASRTAASASMIEAKPTQSTTPLRVSLCLLVWNELEGCKLDVPGLPLDQFDEVYAVDGGSKDGTVAYLEQHGIKVHAQQKRGYNAAIIECFEHCTTDALVLYHPKGSIEPIEVLRCKKMLADGYDLAVGVASCGAGATRKMASCCGLANGLCAGWGCWARCCGNAAVARPSSGLCGMCCTGSAGCGAISSFLCD